jgi:hypothetical protein
VQILVLRSARPALPEPIVPMLTRWLGSALLTTETMSAAQPLRASYASAPGGQAFGHAGLVSASFISCQKAIVGSPL